MIELATILYKIKGNMLHRFTKFIKLSSEEKKLFIEAYILLGIMRISILTISFKRLTHSLKQTPYKELSSKMNDSEMLIALSIKKSILSASKHTPWDSACLVQSLTAHRMLDKRGIAGVFYLGVSKDEDSTSKIKAHAWSQCGDLMITGEEGHKNFTVLSVFSWRKE